MKAKPRVYLGVLFYASRPEGAPEPELDSRAICRVHRNGIISQGKRSAMPLVRPEGCQSQHATE
jgi:hypothetical protein